jgi:2-oxoglutarate ferredoxin oxidoreductase subunit alpha
LTVRIGGAAGQGVQSAGDLLLEALAGLGLHVLAAKSYMSRIRGGLNWYDIRIGAEPLFGPPDKADVLVAMTEASRDLLGDEVSEGGVVLYDGEAPDDVLGLPLTETAKDVGGSALMANVVAAGAVFALLGYPVEALEDDLRDRFVKKGDDVIAANVACARRGAELVGDRAGSVGAPAASGAPGTVITGADALAIAAAEAGVKLVTAYPMTPGTGTFTALASLADEYGIVVEQAEDEIAAINMVCGATYAGVPALTTTSGGGFALMAEGLSLAGIMELPATIVVAQRPGPATGLPTRTAQQDLKFAVSAGHGEFPRAIFAPGTVSQCRALMRRALETAHEFQTPVILLTDQFLQDLATNAEPVEAAGPIDRCLVDAGADYVRYAVTDSGVSPRAAPGGEAFVVCDSDSHGPDGHISEDTAAHVAQQDKRMRKLDGLRVGALAPELYGPEKAETLLIVWGSTYGPCREAVDAINADGGSAAMLHFAQVWPLDAARIAEALGRRKRIVCVEGNQTGQFASLLREVDAIGECELVGRYDGFPLTRDYIRAEVSPR